MENKKIFQKGLACTLVVTSFFQSMGVYANTSQTTTSSEQKQVGRGVIADIITQVNSGKITTADELEAKLSSLTLEERKQYLIEMKTKLSELESELSQRQNEANISGKAYISSKLGDISIISGLIYIGAGVFSHNAIMEKDWSSSTRDNTYAMKDASTKRYKFVKQIAILALVAGATSIVSQGAEAYIDQSIAVDAGEIERIKGQVNLARRNVDILLNDLLISKQVEVSVNRSKQITKSGSQVSQQTFLNLDPRTRQIIRDSMLVTETGSEVFMQNIQNLPLETRKALLNDAIKTYDGKVSELKAKLTQTGYNQKVQIDASLTRMQFMHAIGLIATGALRANHYFNHEGKIEPQRLQKNFILGVRLMYYYNLVAFSSAFIYDYVNSYQVEATKPQVQLIKEQLERALKEMEKFREILNTEEYTVQQKVTR